MQYIIGFTLFFLILFGIPLLAHYIFVLPNGLSGFNEENLSILMPIFLMLVAFQVVLLIIVGIKYFSPAPKE